MVSRYEKVAFSVDSDTCKAFALALLEGCDTDGDPCEIAARFLADTALDAATMTQVAMLGIVFMALAHEVTYGECLAELARAAA